MAKKRVSRKEIKQPDEFVTFWMRTFNYFELHRQLLFFLVLAIVVAGASIWGGIAYWERGERDSSELLSKAQSLLLATGGAASKNSQDEAEKILVEVIARHKRSAASELARVLLGNIYFQRKEYEKSIATYQSLRKMNPRDHVLEALACEGLGYSYEQTHDYAQALTYYQKLTDSAVEYMREDGFWGMARCDELQNKPEEALDVYRKFLSKYPQSPKAAETRSNIARLSSLPSQSKAPVTETPGEGGKRHDTPEGS